MKHGTLAYKWRGILGFPKDYCAFLYPVFISIAQYISGFCRCSAYTLSELTVQIEHKCGRQMIATAFHWPRTAVLIWIQGFCDMTRCPLEDRTFQRILLPPSSGLCGQCMGLQDGGRKILRSVGRYHSTRRIIEELTLRHSPSLSSRNSNFYCNTV